MHRLAIETTLVLMKVLALAYDVITLPIYAIFQQPWVYWKRKRSCAAKPLIEGDRYSPYRKLKCPEFDAYKGCHTLSDVARVAVLRHAKRFALGTRPLLASSEEKQPNGKVFKKLVLGDYEWITFEEADRKIDATARGLLAIGARPRKHLAIFAETRVEWLLTAQACLRTNVPLVTLYATMSNDAVVNALNETQVTHLVTSADLLPRVQSFMDKIPSVTHVVYMDNANSKLPAPSAKSPKVIPFSALEQRGEDYQVPAESSPTADDVAIVMFTSGSSGVPKGVVQTHRSLLSVMNSFGSLSRTFNTWTCRDAHVAYLPLAHMFELMTELILFGVGARIGYSSPLTFTDKSTALAQGCRGDVSLVRPTYIPIVPLVAERLRKGISDAAASAGPFFKAFFDYAVRYKNFWLDLGFDTPLLNRLVFKKTRLLLGGSLEIIATGSAPLSKETRRFLRACFCCYVAEGYGLTETGGAGTFMDAEDVSDERVGAPLPGCYVRLVDWPEGKYSTSDKPNPRGEIVVGGTCVAQGYFKNEELTRESFREEGGLRWCYTGDIGEIFPDGTLKIIDRKKDLIKLQHGEYVPLSQVEKVLKACSLVDNVFAYGSSLHTYLVAFVVPNPEELVKIAREIGRELKSATLKELCEDAEVAKVAEDRILAYAQASRLQKIEVPRKVKLCAEEWMPHNGLVTATFKLRRKSLQCFYQRDIDALYASGEDSRVGRM
uniref:long-chain-fatty-acid--CoA ligase n=1 Tax=Amblyomma aureolatum TaxID=187763 RepID=A0A1E1XDH5_9ACAR